MSLKNLILLLSFLLITGLSSTSSVAVSDKNFQDAKRAYESYLQDPQILNLFPLFKMHAEDNSFAETFLGDLFYNGKVNKKDVESFFDYETNEDAAFFFFNEAVDDFGPNGHRLAAYYLGRNFYGNEDSKYFNLRKALEYLFALDALNIPEATFELGYLIYFNADKLLDPEDAKTTSIEKLKKAAEAGHTDAHYVAYLFMAQHFDKPTNAQKNEMMRHLETAASQIGNYQSTASLLAAGHYKRGDFVERNTTKFMSYAKKSAELNNPDGHYFYGKHLLMGVGGSPDYGLAEYHLKKARELGNKFAQKQLDKLEEKQAFERSLDVFEPELEQVMEMFGAAQSFYTDSNAAGLPKAGGFYDGQTASIDFGADEQEYNRRGNDFIGSGGQTWRISGNTMRNIATGEYYRFSGNQITGSRGDRWKINRNRIQSLDNPNLTYKLGRRGIQGSNGTVCKYRVNTLRCN